MCRCAFLLVFFCLIVAATARPATARPQVAGLQVALRAHGLYLASIDGIYGPASARGLRRITQSRSGCGRENRPRDPPRPRTARAARLRQANAATRGSGLGRVGNAVSARTERFDLGRQRLLRPTYGTHAATVPARSSTCRRRHRRPSNSGGASCRQDNTAPAATPKRRSGWCAHCSTTGRLTTASTERSSVHWRGWNPVTRLT